MAHLMQIILEEMNFEESSEKFRLVKVTPDPANVLTEDGLEKLQQMAIRIKCSKYANGKTLEVRNCNGGGNVHFLTPYSVLESLLDEQLTLKTFACCQFQKEQSTDECKTMVYNAVNL